MAAAAASLAPATSHRSKSLTTLRFLFSCSKNQTSIHALRPVPRRLFPFSSAVSLRRYFSSVISGALQSGGRTNKEALGTKGSKIGEFRKKLEIADIKGGPDEGLSRLGQTPVVMGWVRILRAQSSITFIEVNDGSCLSNIQCVMASDAEGYDQLKWGCDLQSEHERYITEEVFNGCPVIIRGYPKVGELIGGSQREERLDFLENCLDELKLNKDSFWWYLDLRRYGSVPHSGFGLGFERLVQFATGIENIRDAIPFPRTPGSAEF